MEAHPITAHSMRTRHPHNFDLRSNLSKKAKQLLRRIAGWPDLNDELRQNAEFLVQVAEDGGQTNLAHAGIQKHRGNFVYERNSIAARCIITHYLREHFGVRITDDRGVTWAVRGGPVPGDREWITHAMSFGTLGAAGKPLAASDTSHQVLSAAHDQDLHRSLKLLIWMSNQSWVNDAVEFTWPRAEVAKVARLGGSSEDQVAEMELILSTINSFRLRRLVLNQNRWQFDAVLTEPAAVFYAVADDRIGVRLSGLLDQVLDDFLRPDETL